MRLVDDRIGVVLEGGTRWSLRATPCAIPTSVRRSATSFRSLTSAASSSTTLSLPCAPRGRRPRTFQQTAETEVLVPTLPRPPGAVLSRRRQRVLSVAEHRTRSKASSKVTSVTRTTSSHPCRPNCPMGTTGGADRARTSSRTSGVREPRQCRLTPRKRQRQLRRADRRRDGLPGRFEGGGRHRRIDVAGSGRRAGQPPRDVRVVANGRPHLGGHRPQPEQGPMGHRQRHETACQPPTSSTSTRRRPRGRPPRPCRRPRRAPRRRPRRPCRRQSRRR